MPEKGMSDFGQQQSQQIEQTAQLQKQLIDPKLPPAQQLALRNGLVAAENDQDPLAEMAPEQKRAGLIGENFVKAYASGHQINPEAIQQVQTMSGPDKTAFLTGAGFEAAKEDRESSQQAGKQIADHYTQTGKFANPDQQLPGQNSFSQQNGLQKTAYTPGQSVEPMANYGASQTPSPVSMAGKQQGVMVSVNGQNVRLQPGTSMTIGPDGQMSIQTGQVNSGSAQPTAFPGDHMLEQTGFQQTRLVDPTRDISSQLAMSGSMLNPASPMYPGLGGVQLGAVDTMRQNYAQKGPGFSATTGTLAKQEQQQAGKLLAQKDRSHDKAFAKEVSDKALDL